MNPNERFVFDTNILVSGLLFAESKPAQAFFLALRTGILLTSFAALHELSSVLHRKKFDKYLTRDERDQFLDHYTRSTITIDITTTVQVCRDPKDDKFLEIATNGAATYLVTGDLDLLVLHPFRGIVIISPDAFLQTLPQAPSGSSADTAS